MSSPPPNHLIIVCGHAIWLGGPENGWDESEWLIEPYKKGETPTFIAHIKAGLEELAKDDRAVLMFSGGPTRPETRLSEAQSYYNLALANSFFDLSPSSSSSGPSTAAAPFSNRIFLEERALDSYYNILFSLIQYWRVVHPQYPQHAWPERITIVSHAFKRNRLVDGHCAAIFGLSSSSVELEERVRFVGINPPGVGGDGNVVERDNKESNEKKEAMQGVQLALGQWAEDPHGVGEELAGKRRARNCWRVDQRLFFSEEERRRSGVETRMMQDGSEVLVDGEKPRPWAK